MQTYLNKYAQLLVNYCLEVGKNDRVLVRSTTLAEPLVKEVYKEVLKAGGHPHTLLSMAEETTIFHEYAQDHQLDYASPFIEKSLKEFEKYLYIMAPYNLREGGNIDPEKRSRSKSALKSASQAYSRRTASGEMNRNLCLYPTQAGAQEAGISLSEYEAFVYNACRLNAENPAKEWLKVRSYQQVIVDYLNTKTEIRYVNPLTDISFKTKGRTWINSDGRTNMPSGEVYTSPIEDSVNGRIHFDYPAIFQGKEVQGVTLTVKDGYIESWQANRGQEVLDEVFQIEGTRRFGEAAIGTNTEITQFTKNILFDEKIGGTIHMAIGQSYLQAGGKNQSSVHWDMIADMTSEGKIYADGELFYENGKFILL